jgi:formylglycine-generating enzyme required for sulfatase activity
MFKKVLVWVAWIAVIVTVWALTANLDLVLRIWNSVRDGSLNSQKIRYEIAAFDIGRQSANTPVAVKRSGADGMTQVFIPEGEFIMGRGTRIDRPFRFEHAVYLDAFWIDQVEVTNAMYAMCVNSGACPLPLLDLDPYYGRWAYRNNPVIYMNWFSSKTYCEWAGRRLPTEAEWEKAARGTDQRVYPWGNARPSPQLANFDEALIGEPVSAYRYPLSASPYGALNMAGNVREWVADWFDDLYYSYSPYKNPTGPTNGFERVLRSGAYDARFNGMETYQRYRHEPDSPGLSRGFRCAESAK